MNIIWITIIVLGVTGIIAAVVLWFVAKKFYVHEDPKIAEVEAVLPGANCGGCGESGCHAFACACVNATTLEGLACPGAGSEGMAKIAAILGLAAVKTVPRVAVVKCAGSCDLRPARVLYQGARSCALESSFCSGTGDCVYGCLGCGDCVASCPYDSIHLDAATGLPVVDMDKCVGCGKCVKACPRNIIELQPKTGDKAMVWVTCNNHDRGPAAMKECGVSCIGCMKCKKVCPSEAVTVDSFLSYIDPEKCIGCGECIEACPRKCITSHGELHRPEKEASVETDTVNK